MGLHSRTDQRIRLASRRGGDEIVADLPQGTAVHVLLAYTESGPDGEPDVLVATRFGLVGWWRQPQAGMLTSIGGLRFCGD